MNTVRVLPDCCSGREESSECLPIGVRSLCPISPDWVPTFAQALLIGVPILRDDRSNAVRMPRCQSKARWRTVVEYIDRKPIETDDLGKAINNARDIFKRVMELLATRHI